MRSISRQQLESKIRCWRCGQLGHRARDCKGERLPAVSTGRRAYFVHDFDPESEEKSWAVLHNQSFTTIPSNLTLIDTGAVNALVGECQFLAIDRLLKTFGLGTVPTQPPQGLGWYWRWSHPNHGSHDANCPWRDSRNHVYSHHFQVLFLCSFLFL